MFVETEPAMRRVWRCLQRLRALDMIYHCVYAWFMCCSSTTTTRKLVEKFKLHTECCAGIYIYIWTKTDCVYKKNIIKLLSVCEPSWERKKKKKKRNDEPKDQYKCIRLRLGIKLIRSGKLLLGDAFRIRLLLFVCNRCLSYRHEKRRKKWS